jgi:hypothetical protein
MWRQFLCAIGLHLWEYIDHPERAGKHPYSPFPPMPMASERVCTACRTRHTYSAYLGEWGV